MEGLDLSLHDGLAVRSSRMGVLLIRMVNRDVPVLSKALRVLLNSDVYCALPTSTVLPHPYGIIINHAASIGERCIILHQVTIGIGDPRQTAAPQIGAGVYIGAGAKILGDLTIGDGAVIGANAVVTRDVPPGGRIVGYNRLLD